MRRALATLLLGAAIGFGIGYVVLEWRPWQSEASTHDAEIALLKRAIGASGTEATCERRQYPTNVFDCTLPEEHSDTPPGGPFVERAIREHPCRYVVTARGDAFNILPAVPHHVEAHHLYQLTSTYRRLVLDRLRLFPHLSDLSEIQGAFLNEVLAHEFARL